MRKFIALTALGAAAAVLATPASAASVVDGSCTSVTSAHGCLFSGNINSTAASPNGYVAAQTAYNNYNDTHPSANPDIFLDALGFAVSTDDANFSSFGAFTGAGGSSGTWNLAGFNVSYIAVKAANNFVLYKLAAPASSGTWNTFDIPYNRNPADVSHIMFFGDPAGVPEPATWAMLVAGFGLTGFAMRRRTKRVAIA